MNLNTTPKKRQKNLCQMAKNEYDTGLGRMAETHLKTTFLKNIEKQ